MRHETIERLDAGVLEGIELVAQAKRHFHAGIRRRLAAPVPDLHVRAPLALALLEMLDDALARFSFVKGQHREFRFH